MSISKNVFGLALGTLLIAGICPAWAQRNSAPAVPAAAADDDEPSEILFKIHSIEPVKNSDGEVIACDFDTTLYNRSTYELEEASLEFVWKDQSIEEVIAEEKKEDERNKERRRGRAYSETERRTSDEVSVTIDVPEIKPYRQITVNNRVNTDRCFLLIENVDYTVNNCSAQGLARGGRSTRGRGNSGAPCAKLFKFVSPEDEQYYLEFKEITPDEEKAEAEAAKQATQKQTEDIYTKAVNALNSAGSIISGIK